MSLPMVSHATDNTTHEHFPILNEDDEDNIWQRLIKGFVIEDRLSPSTMERVGWYLKRKEFFEATLARARPYLHYILSSIEKRHMPTELALLPIVESGFDPFATSRARATGLWQFIPSTGQMYKLHQNTWIDQRRDIAASTEAALDYLNTLHARFQSWRLALIAYNWGDGRLTHVVQQYKKKYHRMPSEDQLLMPKEARYYLPNLEAIKYLIIHAQKYHLSLPHIDNHAYLVAIEIGTDLDIVTIAHLAELSLPEFLRFNPSFRQPIQPHTTSKKNPHIVLLPVDRANTFRRHLLAYEKHHPAPNWQFIHLHTPTSMASLAQKYHTSSKNIVAINSGYKHIVQGDILLSHNQRASQEWRQQEHLIHPAHLSPARHHHKHSPHKSQHRSKKHVL